jgi:hypothetical protein
MASFDRRHAEVVAAEFARQPLGASVLLVEADLEGLPAPVKRYIRASGAIGRPRPQNVRVAFDALMRRKPGADPMVSTSVQYNFFGQPARLFLMQARMFGLPVRALHLYRREAATFQVRVLDLKTIVDQAGPGISGAESVTVLNDWCFMVPGALVDERLSWQPIDDRRALVNFTNGPHDVSATLIFQRARRAGRLLVGRPARQQHRDVHPVSLEHADRRVSGRRRDAAAGLGWRGLEPGRGPVHVRRVPFAVASLRRARAG